MRIKVLFVHHATGVGGAPISMIKTIESLDPSRFEVEVLLLRHSVVEQMLQAKGIKVSIARGSFYAKYYRFFSHIEPAFYRFWEVRNLVLASLSWILSRYIFAPRLLSIYKYDLLHLNSSVLTDFLAPGAACGKVIMHVREPVARGYFGFRLSLIRRQIDRYAAHVIAISRDNAKRLGLSEKMSIVYNFSEIQATPVSLHELSSKVALYVGGDNLSKGFLTVVAALDYLDEGIEVWFCGSYGQPDGATLSAALRRAICSFSPRHRRLMKALNAMRTHPNARVLGLRNDIPELMSKCSVLLSPFSVTHFSRPIVEAFACGRSAIGTNIPGMDELISDGVDGVLVEKDDARALATAVNDLCADIERSQIMATSAHSKAKLLFSPANVTQIGRIYERVAQAL